MLGGGLAGIAAAMRLVDAGVPVTLVETRKRLGGRATSFVDPATGEVLDNCQHVLMRCCTNLLDLYERLGVADCIDWCRRLYFIDPAGRVDVLERGGLPAPLHLLRRILNFASLTARQKFELARGMWHVLRADRNGRSGLHGLTFTDWLRAAGQSEALIDRFWSAVVVSALNETPDRCAADYALQVFQDGFLAHSQAWEVGLPRVPLMRLYDPAVEAIERAGGHIMLSTSIEGLAFDKGRVTGVRLAGGRTLNADAVISTLPFDRLSRICGSEMCAVDERLGGLDRIEVNPILGVHLWFDRPVTHLPLAALLDSPLHWLFVKADTDRGQHVHGVISAARDLVSQPSEAITAMVMCEIRRRFPTAQHATLLHSLVVKEKRATFAIRPGVDAHRPGPHGRIDNLYLAGDWCNSGWPATMEGATRSGYLAAAACIEDRAARHGRRPAGVRGLVPDLPASPLFRLLAPR